MGLKTQTLHFCYLTLVCGPAANSEATWNTTSFWFRICLVCTRVHVCVCVTCRSPYLSWHVQRSEVNIRMSASVASPLFLFRNWGLSLNLESATSARLAGQLASRTEPLPHSRTGLPDAREYQGSKLGYSHLLSKHFTYQATISSAPRNRILTSSADPDVHGHLKGTEHGCASESPGELIKDGFPLCTAAYDPGSMG